jgi:aminomethyltransferase
MRRSPLHELNQSLGARFVDFGGWEMPVQYTSVLAEHRAVREGVGVFDVSHLGRFHLSGDGARTAIRRRLCNDIDRIEPGRCQYTMILNPEGGIVDDLIVWRWEDDVFWVMPNAANHDRVMGEFADEPGCDVADLRDDTAFIAVQGPEAPRLVDSLLGVTPRRMACASADWDGDEVRLAGTGYTGEPGAELCVSLEVAESLFRALTDGGATPCGLGARDTLRLEAGLMLWGEDIGETTTPIEAGLEFAVSLDHDFTGKAVLESQLDVGAERRLVGFVLEERGIPRHGHPVRTSGGGEGMVTSGNLSPMLQTGVGLAYVSPPPQTGDAMEVLIRDRWVPGHIAKPPFHK